MINPIYLNGINISLDSLQNKCLSYYDNNTVSVKNTCEVFLSIFKNNEILTKATSDFNNPNKRIRSLAKISIKNEIDRLLISIRENCSRHIYKTRAYKIIDHLKEINHFPRLAEARFALTHGINPQLVTTHTRNAVYILYDRYRIKPLAIFKELKEMNVNTEVEVAQKLSHTNMINVKETLAQPLKIGGVNRYGIFQKYIKGHVLKDVAEPQDSKSVDQLHLIAIFDMLNNNLDRHPGNIMVDLHGKIWAIDHESAGTEEPGVTDWEFEAAHIPFSQTVKNHIQLLDIRVHVLKSIQENEEQRLYTEYFIEFLKWSIKEASLTLNQIYKVLSHLEAKPPKPTEKNFQKLLQTSFKV